MQRASAGRGRQRDAARASLLAYPWPGNVRELANAIERAVITSDSDALTPDSLALGDEVLVGIAVGTQTPASAVAAVAPPAAAPAAPAVASGTLLIAAGQRNLAEIERLIVRTALQESGGQKSKAAEMLGINRTTLYAKLKDLDVPTE